MNGKSFVLLHLSTPKVKYLQNLFTSPLPPETLIYLYKKCLNR